MKKGIVEGDDFSVLPAPMVRLMRGLGRLFGRSSGGGSGDGAFEDLSDEELAAMEARAAAATAGPWEASVEGRDHYSGDDFIRTGGLNHESPDIYVEHSYPSAASPVPAPSADLDFIAAARQDIPRLVSEVRRLRARP